MEDCHEPPIEALVCDSGRFYRHEDFSDSGHGNLRL